MLGGWRPECLALHLASSRSSDFQRPRPARSCAQPMQAPPSTEVRLAAVGRAAVGAQHLILCGLWDERLL
eukprot:4544557-Prymnesium_polylepis.1